MENKQIVSEFELRIGDLVNEYTGSIIKIEGRHFVGTGYAFHGIPLTEDWLLKFGFEEFINNFSLKCGHRLFLVYDKKLKKIFLEVFMLTEKEIRIEPNSLKYVHQLQNLYFALTGTELTTNRPFQAS